MVFFVCETCNEVSIINAATVFEKSKLNIIDFEKKSSGKAYL
jgi:hypothetical protein